MGAARLHDERQPFRKNVVGADHYRDGKKRRRRVVGPIEHEADDAAGNARERADLKQHMLVENAAPERLNGHVKNVPPDPEDEHQGEGKGQPWSGGDKISLQVEIQQRQRHHRQADEARRRDPESGRSQDQENKSAEAQAHQCREEADPADGRICNDRDRRDAQHHGNNEASCLVHKISLFFLVWPELAGIGDGVPDVAQRLQKHLRAGNRGIVFDQRLFMGQAHGHLVDAGKSPERLLNGAGAKGAVQPTDAGTNLPAIWPRRGLLAPWREG